MELGFKMFYEVFVISWMEYMFFVGGYVIFIKLCVIYIIILVLKLEYYVG